MTTTPNIQIVIDALEFYRREWQGNADGDLSTPGLSRTWQEPTDNLWDDTGAKAELALPAALAIAEELSSLREKLSVARDIAIYADANRICDRDSSIIFSVQLERSRVHVDFHIRNALDTVNE